HQLSVLGAVGGVDQTGHGVKVVLAGKRVERVGPLPVLGQVQPIVPGLAERLIGDGGVPVHIRGAVLVVFVVVKVELVGVLGRNRRHQIIVVLVVGVPRNGGQVAFAQVNIIEVAGLIELEGNI